MVLHPGFCAVSPTFCSSKTMSHWVSWLLSTQPMRVMPFVAVTTTGEARLRMAAARTFALVVLDAILPGIDGFEVLERLRQFSNVPVLMLTTPDHPRA